MICLPCRSSSSMADEQHSSVCSWWRAECKLWNLAISSRLIIPEESSWWSQMWGGTRSSCQAQSCTSPCARCRWHCDAITSYMNSVTFKRQRLTSNKPVNAVAEGEREESHPQVLERHSVAKTGDIQKGHFKTRKSWYTVYHDFLDMPFVRSWEDPETCHTLWCHSDHTLSSHWSPIWKAK